MGQDTIPAPSFTMPAFEGKSDDSKAALGGRELRRALGTAERFDGYLATATPAQIDAGLKWARPSTQAQFDDYMQLAHKATKAGRNSALLQVAANLHAYDPNALPKTPVPDMARWRHEQQRRHGQDLIRMAGLLEAGANPNQTSMIQMADGQYEKFSVADVVKEHHTQLATIRSRLHAASAAHPEVRGMNQGKLADAGDVQSHATGAMHRGPSNGYAV